MICRMMQLLILTSCVCAATFEVKVAKWLHLAEEDHNITLEWTFTTKPDVSRNDVSIMCYKITDEIMSVLYHAPKGVEVPESQDERFAGRVQSDVRRDGRIRLHVSRLRMNDSGWYMCQVKTNDGVSSAGCLLWVTPSVTVKALQSSYQAEENHNITLEWSFTTRPNTSWSSVSIGCVQMTKVRVPVLYRAHNGVEVPESQDEQFAGRVQIDKDVLREGRIRLHVSGVRVNDSGLYMCSVKTDYGMNVGSCWLDVTAGKPESGTTWGGWIIVLCIPAAILVCCCLAFCCHCCHNINKMHNR